MKTIFIVIDGLGDESIPAFNGKTPLAEAYTPSLDKWAKEGRLGLLLPVYRGAFPTSEEGHFSLFGYDVDKYNLSRGIITASGAGIDVKKGDIALRGNFATVKDGKLLDRRAGRIKDPSELIEEINGMKIEGVEFIVKNAGEYRVGIVMKGKDLSSRISDGDLHYGEGKESLSEIKALGKEAEFTAKILNRFLRESHEILKNHPVNKERELSANYILTRGASEIVELPSFEKKYGMRSACIAGKSLYKEIGKILGMDILKVEGANGLPNTNLKGKFHRAREAIFEGYDFVFVHIKATDSLAEDGNFKEKKNFIEKIDKNISALEEFTGILVVTSDHSTCSLQASHCNKDIPLLIRGKGKDSTSYFSEKECERGSLGKIDQRSVLRKVVFS